MLLKPILVDEDLLNLTKKKSEFKEKKPEMIMFG